MDEPSTEQEEAEIEFGRIVDAFLAQPVWLQRKVRYEADLYAEFLKAETEEKRTACWYRQEAFQAFLAMLQGARMRARNVAAVRRTQNR